MNNRILVGALAAMLIAQVAIADEKKKVKLTGDDGTSLEVQVDGDDSDDRDVEVGGDTAAAVGLTKGNKLVIEGAAKKMVHACAPKQEVTIQGSSHQITLTGECQGVTVEGTQHTVTVEAAGKITVSGVGNTVSYERGLNKKGPKIDKSGLNNKVSKIEKK